MRALNGILVGFAAVFVVTVSVAAAVGAAAAGGGSEPVQAPAQSNAGLALPVTAPGATYVGSEVCGTCHYETFISYQNQVHSQARDPRTPASRFGCESCHGPASAHVAGGGGKGVGNLMAFTKTAPTADRNAVCLQCHTRGATALWHGSTHDERKLACMDCHAVHGGHHEMLAQPTQQQLCTSCHQQVRSAIAKTSHHPIREGKMQCTSCHNPHGTQAPRLISANSINDKCYECHAETRGPFLWEHPPVRESCLNCHDPHGTSHEPMLVVKKPLLCQRCHSNALHPSTLYALAPEQIPSGKPPAQLGAQLQYRSCSNCHVTTHGSNHPSGKFWHR